MIIISQLCSPTRALSLHCLDLNTTGSPDVPRCVFIWYFSQLWIIKVSYIVLGWGEGGEFHITRVLCMRGLFSWASLIAWLVKNPPAMQETPVQLLGREDSLEKRLATHSSILGFPLWLSWERICLQCRRPGFHPWVGKIPWRRERLPTPVFCPGELYSPWGRKESDMTEWLSLSVAWEGDCEPPWQTASLCAVWQPGRDSMCFCWTELNGWDRENAWTHPSCLHPGTLSTAAMALSSAKVKGLRSAPKKAS